MNNEVKRINFEDLPGAFVRSFQGVNENEVVVLPLSSIVWMTTDMLRRQADEISRRAKELGADTIYWRTPSKELHRQDEYCVILRKNLGK